ncbi:MAG: YggS family pyridoxal phosphate-dependent enzyme, partial [Acidobacteriota bacterium]
MPPGADVAGNIDSVRRRIAAAAQRAGRSPTDIRLVAVSKTFDALLVRDAASHGQLSFGENRVQEGAAKIAALSDLALEWHLIGHLQSNKAAKAAALFAWIESVDSVELLQRIDRAAVEAGTRPSVLIQVDLAREVTKHGATQDRVSDLVQAAAGLQAATLRGLMTVPPIPERTDDSRQWFQRLRQLRDDLVSAGAAAESLRELSMGMSHDFEVAIEEGATIVRVGTAIFG